MWLVLELCIEVLNFHLSMNHASVCEIFSTWVYHVNEIGMVRCFQTFTVPTVVWLEKRNMGLGLLSTFSFFLFFLPRKFSDHVPCPPPTVPLSNVRRHSWGLSLHCISKKEESCPSVFEACQWSSWKNNPGYVPVFPGHTLPSLTRGNAVSYGHHPIIAKSESCWYESSACWMHCEYDRSWCHGPHCFLKCFNGRTVLEPGK